MAFNLPQNLFGGNPFGGGGGMSSAVSGGGGQNPFMKFIQSDGGSSILSAVLGGLGNMGQQQSQERMSKEQLAAQQAMMQQQMGVDDRWRRDQAMVNAAPTGWGQNYQQETLMKNLMLQRLMEGGGFTHPNAAVAAKLQKPSPLVIPDEWKSTNPFGVDQTMQSIAQRQGVLDMLSQGQGPGFNFGATGYDPAKAAQLDSQTKAFRNFQSANNPLQSAVNMGRNGQMPQQPAQAGGSRFGGAAKGAMTGAGIGSMVPGIGTAIGAGIGGLIGLFKGGGKPKAQPFDPVAYNRQRAQNPYL